MDRPHDSLIVQMVTRALVPVIQLYAAYVVFHGQVSPGGGFVGGVAFGATLLLVLLVFGNGRAARDIRQMAACGEGLGLLLFAAVGGACFIGLGEYLNYASLPVFGMDVPTRRYLGILITMVGVAVDVAVVGISIFFSLSSPASEDPTHD